MKWSWKGPKAAEWRNRKRQELADRLNVPISDYDSNGQIHFLPYLDSRTIQPVDAPTLEAQLLRQLGKNGKTFAALYEMGWHFDELFAVALTLVRKGKAKPNVDRNGKFAGLYI